MATRTASDIARGLGIEASVGGMVARSVTLEQQATAISNSGYLPNDTTGRNSKRVGAKALMGDARAVSDQYGVDAATALDALAGFAAIAGDLALGRDMLNDMAKLSAATGTELGEMAAAAANVANQLGDIPDKEAAISRVMRVIAGQGKLGAVEISDLATQMAKIAASAIKFEGNREDNILKMGAFTQVARSTGGAHSAAAAATSVASFANTLQKTARINEFKAHGVDVFADKGKTKFKDPFKIVEESLLATGGNMQEMNKLFMDVRGAKTVGGLAGTFNAAGGGESGIAAVRAELDGLMKKAMMSDAEVDESADLASKTKAARAQRLQNKLDDVTAEALEDLMPALEKLAPKMVLFAELMADMVTWAAENPFEAVLKAIEFSILRAGIESVFRTGIERAILRGTPAAVPFGPYGGGGGGGKGGSAGGGGTIVGTGGPSAKGSAFGRAAGAAMQLALIAAAADFAHAVGKQLIDSWNANQNEAMNKQALDEADAYAAVKGAKKDVEGGGELSEGQRESLKKLYIEGKGREAVAEINAKQPDWFRAFDDMIQSTIGTKSDKQVSEERSDAVNLEQLKRDNELIRQLLGGTLKVKVENAGEIASANKTDGNVLEGTVPAYVPGVTSG